MRLQSSTYPAPNFDTLRHPIENDYNSLSHHFDNYFSYEILYVFGQLRVFFCKIIDWWSQCSFQGYAPICLGLDDFYVRRLYLRIQVEDIVRAAKRSCNRSSSLAATA